MTRLFSLGKWLCPVLTMLAAGCGSTPVLDPQSPDMVILVPGLGGDGGVYAQVLYALRDSGSPDRLQIFDWGYGWGLFFVTISSADLHEKTELRLASEITHWRQTHPGSRIVLIAHSAGAGVVLGALGRLPTDTAIGPIILLAPAVSPDYDLSAALGHTNLIHVFYSNDDFFWQGIGPTVFGEYDRAHSSGAGRYGFTLKTLLVSQKQKVIQHPYLPQWKQYDNDGAHFNDLSAPFVAKILEPLVDPQPKQTVTHAVPAQSSAANPR